MRLSETTSGVFTIMATPFDTQGRLDLDALGPMMAFYRDAGCDGVTLLGVMGEAPKMSSGETRALLTEAVRYAGHMTVLVGLGAMGVAPFCEASKALVDLGAHGVMVNAPATLKTDADGVSYFTQVGQGLGDIPFVLQDFPVATGVHLPSETLKVVGETCENLMMLKLEDWPSWSKITHLRARADKGEIRRLSILSGFGALYLPEDLMCGSDGAMTGFSFPEMLRAVCDLAAQDAHERMYDVFDAFAPLVRMEMSLTTGLAVRKYILHRRGVLPTPTLRAPGAALTPDDRSRVDRLLARLEQRCDAIGFDVQLVAPLAERAQTTSFNREELQ
ncbi:dihydrodipicolinate synthase family protein [Sulfitobacter sp. TSTF-M16]|uniref:Dihydrodipicolinate synthase family protein n=1 Tax=Sulfitobacter aestuariivivens TaxID=2766981 RepID=A0A927D5Z3_9RHOB|nr:dihydrodipicolinate synthase family protein [Sulfitobacter aestuariivivens]MBD3665748.1 dihydrodipicolinate synthase family protein [Sulfitobacter aestuariivivens]